jgi:hypothetical protein
VPPCTVTDTSRTVLLPSLPSSESILENPIVAILNSSLIPLSFLIATPLRILGTSAWSQIIVGGSNFGELLGALSVLLLTNYVPTPIPFLRLDALALNLVWVMPFIAATKGDVAGAWKVAACFIPIS